MKRTLVMALAAGLLIAADGPGDDAAKAEAKKLQGTWVLVACENDGEKVPEKILRGEVVRFVIGPDTITVKVEDQIKSEDRYAVDLRGKLAGIDLTGKDGRKAVGIYSLAGEKLQICWTERDNARPTEFATVPGSGLDLFVLKREK